MSHEFYGPAPKITADEPIDGEQFTTDLPEWLQGTAQHDGCRHVYLVDVLSVIEPGKVVRTMAFRGVTESGAVLVSMPRPFGHAAGLHSLPAERIAKHSRK